MAVFAARCPGARFTVVDLSGPRIAAWNEEGGAELPIYEPGLADVVRATRGRNLFFSTDIEGAIDAADIIFVSVNTPTKTSGVGAGRAADLCYIESCARTIARAARSSKIVVEKSTIPVRTAEALRAVLYANRRDPSIEFRVLSNPEFLAEGTAVRDLEAPSRVLVGGDDSEALRRLCDLYAHWVPRERILVTSVWSSELSKLVANAFLAQRVSSINSISALCERTGADVREIARAVGTDPRIGPHFLTASVGFGGSCFRKDVLNLVYICEQHGLEDVARYWEGVLRINDYQKRRFSESIVRHMFGTLRGKRVAVLGFAFKKDTSDVRDTPAASVVRDLLLEGAHVALFDPKVRSRESVLTELALATSFGAPVLSEDALNRLELMPSAAEAADRSHAIVVLTEWDAFRDLDFAAFFAHMEQPAFVFDGRNLLDHAALRRVGFCVVGVGIGKSE
jgi:UDPglucose 6-dehydrogenase